MYHQLNIIQKARLFFAAVLIVLAPSAYAQEYFKNLGMEGVELYGSINYGYFDELTTLNPALYKFDADNYYRPEVSAPVIKADMSGGCVYNNGKIYANVFDDSKYVQMVKPKWTVYDAETLEVLSETELSDNCENTTRSLAYDPVTNKIYGLNYTYTETFLVEIEPETGSMRRIGERLDPDAKFYCVACNRRGVLYCLYLKEDSSTGQQYHYLAKVQKTTGKIALVGEIKANNLLPNDLLINMKYKQTMFFDNSRNKLYWMLGSSSLALDGEYTAILEINPLNAQATLSAYINKLYHISGAFLKEPSAAAPAIVTDFSWEAEAVGSQDVSFRIGLPSTDYSGGQLAADEDLTIIVEEDGLELLRGSGKPGTVYRSGLVRLSNDMHNVRVRVENATGSGPAVKRAFYVGYDEPDVCRNILLKSDGLTTTLTWDAPDGGQHGAPINSAGLTYKIIRLPDEALVAEKLKEREFTESHPSDMTRYAYSVVAVDGEREGKSAYSNQLVVGSPLDPPYGGIFRTYNDMYNYYTILDENNDRFTWSYDKNTASAYYGYNMYNDADDWLISPPINYKGGKEYVLKFKAYSSLSSYLESMEVKFGDERTPEGQNRLLLDIPAVPSVDEDHPVTQYEVPFTVDRDGVYYYSFHANTERYHEYLFIFDIKVAEKEGSSISVVRVGDDPVAVKAIPGFICISNPAEKSISVYDVNGRLVSQTAAISSELPVLPGIYMVNTGTQVHKIAVF